jgi:hypothetical protein
VPVVPTSTAAAAATPKDAADLARMQRLGLPIAGVTPTKSAEDKLAQRQARFGTAASSSPAAPSAGAAPATPVDVRALACLAWAPLLARLTVCVCSQEATLQALKKRQERFNTQPPLLAAAELDAQVRHDHVRHAPSGFTDAFASIPSPIAEAQAAGAVWGPRPCPWYGRCRGGRRQAAPPGAVRHAHCPSSSSSSGGDDDGRDRDGDSTGCTRVACGRRGDQAPPGAVRHRPRGRRR